MKVGLILTAREERSSGKLGKYTETGNNIRDRCNWSGGAVGNVAATSGLKVSCAVSNGTRAAAQGELFGGDEGDFAVDRLLRTAAASTPAAGFATKPGEPDAASQIAKSGGDDQNDTDELVI